MPLEQQSFSANSRIPESAQFDWANELSQTVTGSVSRSFRQVAKQRADISCSGVAPSAII